MMQSQSQPKTSSRASDRFRPPSAEQVAELLERHGPELPQRWVGVVFIVAIAATVLLAAAVPNLFTVTLPWLVILALVITMSVRLTQQRRGAQLNRRAHELSLLRRYDGALRLIWKVLPRVARRPAEHGKAVGLLAHDLDAIGCHEAAVVAYDYLIQRMPPDHPGRVEMRLRKAINLLMEDRLADADDILRGARSTVGHYEAPTLDAWLTYATLLQDIRTNHDAAALATALDDEPGVIHHLQPLGMQAAYAHALLSLAGHRWIERQAAREHDDAAEPSMNPDERELTPQRVRGLAERSWRRATLLMAPSALKGRHPELGIIQLPPAERPDLRGMREGAAA